MPEVAIKTLLLLLCVSDVAWAEDPAPRPSPASANPATPVARSLQSAPSSTLAVERRWYGWQNLAVGLPGAGMLAFGRFAAEKSGGAVGFFSGYPLVLLGSPIVHWSHGHVAKGFASLGINAVSTFGFALIVPTSCTNVDGDDPEGKMCDPDVRDLMPPGAIIGALVGLGIDAAFLAHEDAPATNAKPLLLVPQATANRNGFTVGLSGSF